MIFCKATTPFCDRRRRIPTRPYGPARPAGSFHFLFIVLFDGRPRQFCSFRSVRVLFRLRERAGAAIADSPVTECPTRVRWKGDVPFESQTCRSLRAAGLRTAGIPATARGGAVGGHRTP